MGMDYYLNPPPAEDPEEVILRRLNSRAGKLRHFLATDHEAARARAKKELEGIERAIAAIRGPVAAILKSELTDDELLGID